uniref:Uncharacterized protein n=1 Tax=Anguilla anguilla TaxID=7936 RepID=A0A0E9VL97_ANGAN
MIVLSYSMSHTPLINAIHP